MQEELVRQAQQGDAEAFDALALMVGHRCMAIAVRILRDRDPAEDAVQAALITAWTELRALRDPSRFEPWLHRILTNACYAEARRRTRWSEGLRILPVADAHGYPDDYLTVDDRDLLERAFVGPWRMPTMNKLLPIGLGATAVLVVVLVGSRLVGSPSDVGPGAAPSPTPASSVAEPSTEPTAKATPVGGLEPGSYVFTGVGDGPQLAVTTPAPGWDGDGGTLVKNGNADPPDGAGMIGPWYGPLSVYGDPCRWSTTTPKTPSTTVDELVAALAAQTSRGASAPVDITVDGYSGKSITLHVPDDAVFGDCDGDKFGSWDVVAGLDDGPDRYHQGPGQIDELVILDVSGTLMTFDAAYYKGTPAGDLAELHAILDSMTFKK